MRISISVLVFAAFLVAIFSVEIRAGSMMGRRSIHFYEMTREELQWILSACNRHLLDESSGEHSLELAPQLYDDLLDAGYLPFYRWPRDVSFPCVFCTSCLHGCNVCVEKVFAA